MSEDAADVVRRWFEGTSEGDLAVELWHPDALIENARGWVLEVEYRGHDGVRQWWNDLAEAFADFRMELDELTPLDEERVLTTQRFVGHFRATGIELDGPWASVCTVRHGLIVHAVGYFTKQQAMKAAGATV